MLRRDFWARLPASLLLVSAPAVFAADAKPIARVGTETIGADALVRRLAKIPAFQRAAWGDDPDKLKHHVLDAELIPDLLAAQEASRLKLGERAGVRERERELLRAAMERQLRQELAQKSPLTAAEIQAYFEANRGRFETPRRLHVWRILTDDEALAQKIIAESRGVDGLQRWSTFARESSLDKATHLRNGDLGFVHPDGNTDTPTLRVDPALFVAADALTDGELSAQPLKLGAHFAVIWRRGSMKAVTRTLAQEEGSIRQVLERQRLEQARDALLSELRAKYVTASNEALLESIPYDVQGVPSRQFAPRAAHPAAAGSSLPVPSERGER
jgi:peptidyl-prolyl cis-trans isomerase C